jgi:hypothetical protein
VQVSWPIEALKKPRWQEGHEVADEAALADPVGHGVHWAAPAAEKVPGAHGLHERAATPDEDPAGQMEHDEEPAFAAKRPGSQAVHWALPRVAK